MRESAIAGKWFFFIFKLVDFVSPRNSGWWLLAENRVSSISGFRLLCSAEEWLNMLAMSRDSNELDYETKHVHHVYEEIATHFSSTRYKVCFLFSLVFLSEGSSPSMKEINNKIPFQE
jgi:hypothetical protein